jgi:hypothetical protein
MAMAMNGLSQALAATLSPVRQSGQRGVFLSLSRWGVRAGARAQQRDKECK